MLGTTTCKYINIHAHVGASIKRSDEFRITSFSFGTDALPSEYFVHSVGFHPWYLPSPPATATIKQFEEWVKKPHVVAIGECGFDGLRGGGIKEQNYYFEVQYNMAEKLDKAMVLHVVKGWEPLLNFTKEHKVHVPLVVHGFRGKPQLAQQLLAKGFYLSFGEFFNPQSLQLAYVAGHLLVESDESLLPINDIYTRIAQSLQLSVPQLQYKVTNVAQRVFCIPMDL